MVTTWRRLRAGAAMAGVACGLLSGCETMRAIGLRPHKDSVPKVTAGSEEIEVDNEAPTKGFFKATRRPAALSSEARDIENSLGLGGL